MSDHEFNNYLTLLAGLLRLGERQRRAIAEELRTHLEDRLEELLARGVSREEAVQQALAEFGDAAGLAAQFATISRGRRRRWLMRVTTFSAAAIVLIAAGIVTFWPGRNAGPGMAAAVAQAPGNSSEAPGGGRDKTGSTDNLLEAMLDRRIDVEFVETPLNDCLQFLKDQGGFQLFVRKKTIEDAGTSLDGPVTISLQKVRLNTVLELILRDFQLVHTEKDGVLVITTPDDAESTLEIRVYDCRDLLTMPEPAADGKRPVARIPGAARPALPPTSLDPIIPGGFSGAAGGDPLGIPGSATIPPLGPRGPSPPRGGAAPSGVPRVPDSVMPQFAALGDPAVLAQGGLGGMGGIAPGMGGGGEARVTPLTEHEQRAERLIELIINNVDPQNWDAVGGPGTISEYHGLIVVTQTAQTHKKVERTLNMLRQAAGLEAPQGKVVR